ncbi:MAG TPA: FHA domain-containing protein [Trebonia sp.]|nr:FHA domain-containing protein [Trebonia sp.]
MRGGTEYHIGRDPDGDIVIEDPRVSWRHAVLRADGPTWVLEDAGSTNGTFAGTQRLTRLTISTTSVLRLGNAEDGPLIRLDPQPAPAPVPAAQPAPAPVPAPPPMPAPVPAAPPAPAHDPMSVFLPGVDRIPTQRLPLPARIMRIGRTADNDLAVDDLSVSRRHAELRMSRSGRYEIVDLGSHNGTFVNGEKVAQAEVSDNDIIAIGHSTFRLADGELRQFVDTGDVPFEARDLRVVVAGGKVLVDEMTFPIPGKSFVAIAGPAGSGKSTLLNALVGMRPANSGEVLYDNRDLYKEYAELRHRIGLVPQQDVTHVQLTARAALGYSAELRFPADTSRRERRARIEEVLDDLDMSEHANTRFEKLSGGQRKRACIATELLTQPSMLFLDEPTSPLDAYHKREFMQQLRDIADDGRSVVVITHDIDQVSICDRLLVLAPGGRMAFYGPPAEGLEYFGCQDWADVFKELETKPKEDWSGKFKASPAYQMYVVAPMAPRPSRPGAAARTAPEEPAPPKPRGKLRQTFTLSRRYVRVIAADRGYLMFAGLLPLILGALLRLMPSPEGLGGLPGTNADVITLLLVLVLSACLAGTANSVREIVKELDIFKRERAAGLSCGAYVASKVIVLGAVSILQALIIVLVGLLGRMMPATGAILRHNPLLELLIGVALLAFVSMCLGLAVSSIVSTSEKTMPALVILTMVQVVLSGCVFPLAGHTGLAQLSWIAPARWGMSTMAATINLNVIEPKTTPDPLWTQTAANWGMDIGIMMALGVVCLIVTWSRMRRLSPGRKK